MSEQQFLGSCLCGQVAFDITGSVHAFFHCHCGRCRKATGTGHASNIIVRYSQMAWTRGDQLLRRFDSHFCSNCGSPMPRIATEQSVAVIGAGALDNAPDVTASGRIFQDSRAPWSCQGDTIPHWDQYPDKD